MPETPQNQHEKPEEVRDPLGMIGARV